MTDAERDYQRAYRAKHPEKVRRYARERMRRLRAKGNGRSLLWYNRNKAKAKAAHQRWCAANRDSINAYEKQRKENDPAWRIRRNLSSRIREVIRVFKGAKKAAKTMDLLGCTRAELIVWLERRFKPGMTWENYGAWHVDHRLPCASFDLSDPEQQRRCFHYTNLQPLWAGENISKSDKILAA